MKTERIPFVILVDTLEQQPWTFKFPWLTVPVERKYLGLHKDGMYYPRGDYSIKGFEGRCHIERKNPGDLQGCILGFDGRRERFENELRQLNEIECGAVVVECSFQWMIENPPLRGQTEQIVEMKNLHRTVISWNRQFPRVQWFFCDTRSFAQLTAIRIMENFWRHRND